jgi:hypothetical protein
MSAFTDLLSRCLTVRDETAKRLNTAHRIGSLLHDILDYLNGRTEFTRHTYLSDWVSGETIPADFQFDLDNVDNLIINHVEENVDMAIVFDDGCEIHITNVDFSGTGNRYSIFHRNGSNIAYLFRSIDGTSGNTWSNVDNADISFVASSKILTLKKDSKVVSDMIIGEAIPIPAINQDVYDLEDVYHELNERKQDVEEILPNLLDYAKGSIIPSGSSAGWNVEDIVGETINTTKSWRLDTKEFAIRLQNESQYTVTSPDQETSPYNQMPGFFALKSIDFSNVNPADFNQGDEYYISLYDEDTADWFEIYKGWDNDLISVYWNGIYVLYNGTNWVDSFSNDYLAWNSATKILTLDSPVALYGNGGYAYGGFEQLQFTYKEINWHYQYRLWATVNNTDYDIYRGGEWKNAFSLASVAFSKTGGLTGDRKVLKFTGSNPSSITQNSVSGNVPPVLRTESVVLSPAFIWHTLRNRKASVDYVDDKDAEIKALIPSWPSKVLSGTKNVSTAGELTAAISELNGAYAKDYTIKMNSDISVSSLNITGFTGIVNVDLNSKNLTLTGSGTVLSAHSYIGFLQFRNTGSSGSTATNKVILSNSSARIEFGARNGYVKIQFHVDKGNSNHDIYVTNTIMEVGDSYKVGLVRLDLGTLYLRAASQARIVDGHGIVGASVNVSIGKVAGGAVVMYDYDNVGDPDTNLHNNETFLRRPSDNPPASGVYALKSVDNVLQWEEDVVTTDKIANGAVTAEKIPDYLRIINKLGAEVDIDLDKITNPGVYRIQFAFNLYQSYLFVSSKTNKVVQTMIDEDGIKKRSASKSSMELYYTWTDWVSFCTVDDIPVKHQVFAVYNSSGDGNLNNQYRYFFDFMLPAGTTAASVNIDALIPVGTMKQAFRGKYGSIDNTLYLYPIVLEKQSDGTNGTVASWFDGQSEQETVDLSAMSVVSVTPIA